MEKFTRTCEWCLIEFETEWETKAYCSRYHKEQARQHRKRGRRTQDVPTFFVRTCKGCASQFTTSRTDKQYCSSDCREWTAKQIKAERDKEYENKRNIKLKSRIYFRDNGICGICQEHIDTSLKYPDQMSFSIDHIVPRSKGGKHNFDNLRSAHWICNINRQDKPDDGQPPYGI